MEELPSPTDRLPLDHLAAVASNSTGGLCFLTSPSSDIYTFFFTAHSLVLSPLCVLVLCCGFLKWRRARPAAVSHSDSFTYNMALVELVGVVGNVLCGAGIHRKNLGLIVTGHYPLTLCLNGQAFFHVLTCLEHYLAAVHPVLYRRLRSEGGVQIRNAANASVWAVTLALMLTVMLLDSYLAVDFVLMLCSLSVICFFSLSVLWVLVGSGPGARAGGGRGADQSKRRAFYTILVILVVLLLRFTTGFVWGTYLLLRRKDDCVMMTCNFWMYLPSGLVAPLLFLNRSRKVVTCRANRR